MYSDPGYLLFARESTLLAQKFNVEKLRIEGEATPVAEKHAVGNGSCLLQKRERSI